MESSHSSPKKMKSIESLAVKPVEELVLKPVGGINAACNCNATTHLQCLVCLPAQ